jgi:hypothetical protein
MTAGANFSAVRRLKFARIAASFFNRTSKPGSGRSRATIDQDELSTNGEAGPASAPRLREAREPVNPSPMKPRSNIAQVEGSGTAAERGGTNPGLKTSVYPGLAARNAGSISIKGSREADAVPQ